MNPLVEMTRSFGIMASNEKQTLQLSAGVNWFPVIEEVSRLLNFEVLHQITLRNYGNAAGARFLTNLLERVLLGPRHRSHSVCLTNGTSNAAFVICNVLKRTASISNLITVDPGYPHYEFLSRQLGIFPNLIPANISQDVSQVGNDIIDRIGQTSHSIIGLIDPLNPSGSLLGENYLREIIEVARDRSSYVILDTVCLMPGDDWRLHQAMDLAQDYDNLFIIGSNSKYAGLAGLRTGICVHPKPYTEHLTQAMLLQCLNPVVFGSIVNGLVWAARCSPSQMQNNTSQFIERAFRKHLAKLFREYPSNYDFNSLVQLDIAQSISRLTAQFTAIESSLKQNNNLVNQFCDSLGLQTPVRDAGFNVLVPLSKVLPHLDENTFFTHALAEGLGVLTSKNFSTTVSVTPQDWFVRLGLAMPTVCFEEAIDQLQTLVLKEMAQIPKI